MAIAAYVQERRIFERIRYIISLFRTSKCDTFNIKRQTWLLRTPYVTPRTLNGVTHSILDPTLGYVRRWPRPYN